MSDTEREVERVSVGLTADTVATAIILVWGVAYLITAVLAPGLVMNLPTVVSAGGMGVIGVLLIWSVLRGSRLLTAVLALVEIGLMVGSWTGALRWTVPYDAGLAAVSMAAMDFVVAVALVFKTIQLVDIDVAVAIDE
jgi:hypothetical protein